MINDDKLPTPLQQLYFEQIERDIGESQILGMFYGHFRHKHDEIFKMKDRLPSDQQLQEFIGNALGIWGGSSFSTGWYEYKGGKHPKIEIKDKDFNTLQVLEGAQLINAFKRMFRLPSDQLTLF